jgi:hypothetical protein
LGGIAKTTDVWWGKEGWEEEGGEGEDVEELGEVGAEEGGADWA